MKKSLALVLVLAMAFALAIPAALAEGKKVDVEFVYEFNADFTEVVVNFNVPANTAPGAATYDFYYGDQFDWGGAKAGELMGENGTAMANSNAENTRTVAIATGDPGNPAAGTFAVNTLKVKDPANFKSAVVKVTFANIFEDDATTPIEIGNDGVYEITIEKPAEETEAPVETTEAPETVKPVETEETKTEKPEETKKPAELPGTGAISMVAVAAISAIAGMGALGLRKKEN